MIFTRPGNPLASIVQRLAWLVVMGAAPLLAAPAPAAPAATGGDIVVVYNPKARQIGVSIESSNSEIQRLMQRAFSIHGAFNPSAPSSSLEYVLRFTPLGTNRVAVSMQPKMPGGISFEAEGTGADLNEAAYRAADAVVQKLTNTPGFFAGKLAFVSDRTTYREIYMSDLLGQSVVQLTSDHSTSAYPRWSPDGTKLLYTGYYHSGFPDIILYNLASKTRSVFAGYQGTNTGGIFSPDGKSVAMILSSKEGGTELYVSDAEGKNVRRFTHSTSSKSSPTWSPDGKQIIVACDPQGYPLLYQISASGGPLRYVQTGVYNISEAAWNPLDQNSIAFTQQTASGAMQVLTYDFKTAKVNVLADGYQPCWANDGRHIFYTNRVRGKEQLYLVDSVTKKRTVLTTLGASDPAFVYVK